MQLEGMNQLLREIERIGRTVTNQIEEKALQEAGEFLRDKIKPEVPVRTGNLKENIIVSDVVNGEVNVGPDQQGDAFYGHFLEFGTSKASPKPFIGPVFENNQRNIENKMGDVIRRELGI